MNKSLPPFEIPAAYSPRADLLAGRVILVTGAGQGLGRSVALACAAHGATTALLGSDKDKLAAVYDAIAETSAPEAALIPMDLCTAGDREFESLAHLVRRDLKRLDGVVHCASHFVPLAPLANQTLEQWLVLLRVNLAAPVALTRACLPLLSDASDSSVVFTGETHGAHPAAYWGAFAVAKSALSALATIWSDELEARAVPRINVLIPGPISSPQRGRSHPGEDPGRLRTPEEAARAFLFLLGPDSAAISGRTLEL